EGSPDRAEVALELLRRGRDEQILTPPPEHLLDRLRDQLHGRSHHVGRIAELGEFRRMAHGTDELVPCPVLAEYLHRALAAGGRPPFHHVTNIDRARHVYAFRCRSEMMSGTAFRQLI